MSTPNRFDKVINGLFGQINTKNASTSRMLDVVAQICQVTGNSGTRRSVLVNLRSKLDSIYAARLSETPTLREYFQCRRALEDASRELLSNSSVDSQAELAMLKAAADADLKELISALTPLMNKVVESLNRCGVVISVDSLVLDEEEKRLMDDILEKCIPEEYHREEARYNMIFEEFKRSRRNVAAISVITWNMEAMQGEPLRTDAYHPPYGSTLGEIAELVASDTEIIPDIYVKRREPSRNRITSSHGWWEKQPWDRKLADVPKQRDDRGYDTIVLEAVIRDHDNYMVTLLDNGAVECGMVVDFPPRRSNCPSIRDHVRPLLNVRHQMTLEKILSLSDSSDISLKAMHKGHFPDSCCVYIKGLLNPTSDPPEATLPPQNITAPIQP